LIAYWLIPANFNIAELTLKADYENHLSKAKKPASRRYSQSEVLLSQGFQKGGKIGGIWFVADVGCT
jgi:hypothetical protein